MSLTVATMERQPAVKPRIRIEKPEISVYPGSVQKPSSQTPPLPWIYKTLIVLSYLFSASIFYLVLSTF